MRTSHRTLSAARRSDAARIVFVSASNGVWGAERSMLTLARALGALGARVELVSFSGQLATDWRAATGHDAVTAPRPARGGKISESVALWRRYLHVSAPDDRVVIFTYFLVSLAPAVRLRIGRSIHLSLDMHDNLPRRRGRIQLRAFSAACDSILCVSGFTAAQFGRRRSGVHVLTRPVEVPPEATPSTAVRQTKRIGIVGRLVVEKRHDLIIGATATIPDVELVVRGGLDPDRAGEGTQVLALGDRLLGARFCFEGQVDNGTVMRDLDVVVVANDQEPLGRTVLEAQLSGVVVVVPNTGGSSELVDDGISGFVFEAGNEDSLAAALKTALEGDHSTMRSEARDRAASASSPAKYASAYLAALGHESADPSVWQRR